MNIFGDQNLVPSKVEILVSAKPICLDVETLHCHQISMLNQILSLIANYLSSDKNNQLALSIFISQFLSYLIFGFFLGYNFRDQSYQKLPSKLIEFRRQRLSTDPDRFENKNFGTLEIIFWERVLWDIWKYFLRTRTLRHLEIIFWELWDFLVHFDIVSTPRWRRIQFRKESCQQGLKWFYFLRQFLPTWISDFSEPWQRVWKTNLGSKDIRNERGNKS